MGPLAARRRQPVVLPLEAPDRASRPQVVQVPPPPPATITPVSPNMNITGDTAGTGGVTGISGLRARDGSQRISIDGRVLPSLRRQPPGLRDATWCGAATLASATTICCTSGDRAWAMRPPPGSGSAPKQINIGVQARVEAQLEGLAHVASPRGGRLTLRVTGSTHPRAELPPNLRAHDFLAEVKYQFTVEIPGTPAASGEVTIRIGAPPNGRLELLGAASLDRLTKVP